VRLLILLAALFGTVWLLSRGLKGKQTGDQGTPSQREEQLVQCAVCKTYVPRQRSATVERDGASHYLCSDRCMAAFTDQ